MKVRFTSDQADKGPDGSMWDPRVPGLAVKDLEPSLAEACLADPRFERVAPKPKKSSSKKKKE